ncbi:MAG: DUF362 domain-containing protein [Candidatus Omnitrophica bacterium]|nr:DUF362 domain-containing protein [Candidatus Omnitrophota bacterium]
MVKVSLARCSGYDTSKVYAAVKRAVDLVGGIEAFVKRGARVLIKPNLISARLPEEAVDTHPEVVRSVVRLAKEAGAGSVLIGDSPGGYGANIDEIFDKSGMRAMAKEAGAELVKFAVSRTVDGIPFTRHLFDCDCIISVPKLKTHCITILTAGIKNMYGTVVGLYKAEQHSKSPKERDFAKVISKIYSIAKPHLTVLDAITAMEGDGPSGGRPRDLDLIMAGPDAVAIDTIAAAIIGVEPLDVLVIREAFASGYGEGDPARIELMGDDASSFVLPDFKLPQTIPLGLIPTAITNSIASLIKFKPCIVTDLCRRCKLCKTTCPVNAIEIEKVSCKIDYKKCVRCLCCHEVCPYKAIHIKRNILTRMVWG